MKPTQSEEIHVYTLHKDQPSTLITTVFGGNRKIFTMFVMIVTLCGLYYEYTDDHTLLYLVTFIFLASVELYRERRYEVVNPGENGNPKTNI